MDGPSGSGKSSTSRGVADRLGMRYLDTGAQFRAMTVWMLRHGVDVHDAEAVAAHADRPEILSGTDPLAPTITLDGEDVAEAIRSPETTAAVSPVAAVPAVRQRLLELQRAIISAELGEGGIVVEGRDIGAVVAPDAELKVFLTADPAERARRRSAENSTDVAATAADLQRRDTADSKVTKPLEAAEGALAVDTTHESIDQVVDRLLGLLAQHAPAGVEAP